MVLAFAPIKITSAAIFCPLFLVLAVHRSRGAWEAFGAGFIASVVIMLGGFYWAVYTLHLFGNLPWTAAGALYLVFCGLGALNFPAFTWALFRIYKSIPALRANAYWYAVGIPALFALIEFLVPKLFPWCLGHSFYQALWLNQIVEWTGSSFLSYLACSWGALGAAIFFASDEVEYARRALIVPVGLTLLAVGFSTWRLSTPLPTQSTKRVALIQANIGSLEKVDARAGLYGRVQYTVDQHLTLTDGVMRQNPPPDWILWPETAMPFSLADDDGYARRIRDSVVRWNRPLISGGYSRATTPPFLDYNAAFLLEPTSTGLRTSTYEKNILLAFGEYFPGGETFPILYTWFPEVSNFMRGTEQKILTLADGTRLGITICYEAIVPPFFRKVASQGVHAVINLTNDSWFGPTSEPFQHAALTVFRAIESRTPLIRVTNTGLSFAVDRYGHRSTSTGVFVPGALTVEVPVGPEPVTTFYLRYGDWFIALLAAVLAYFLLRSRRVPIPV
ncbi:apolipoprotein N-acyltransferase [bacterium]|nr:apolipoprotein N-acyltransferase [bacterium]